MTTSKTNNIITQGLVPVFSHTTSEEHKEDALLCITIGQLSADNNHNPTKQTPAHWVKTFVDVISKLGWTLSANDHKASTISDKTMQFRQHFTAGELGEAVDDKSLIKALSLRQKPPTSDINIVIYENNGQLIMLVCFFTTVESSNSHAEKQEETLDLTASSWQLTLNEQFFQSIKPQLVQRLQNQHAQFVKSIDL